MAVKKYNPVTPGTRFRIGNAYAEVTTNVPEKSLLAPLKSTGGRNSSGHMTVRYRGGGHKRKYRIIDFKYILSPNGLSVGQEVVAGESVAPEVGNSLMLKNMPLGTIIHNIEMQPGKGGMIARAAGTWAQLSAKEDRYAVVKLPSGESRKILLSCYATVGTVSNPDHNLQSLGKAGRKRWLGRRPHNRGVVMNPIDHPMGGGEGRSSGGHPRSRTGLMAKGKKTRNTKKQSSKYIVSKRKK
jgi:large subunit ribosomal protein L2